MKAKLIKAKALGTFSTVFGHVDLRIYTIITQSKAYAMSSLKGKPCNILKWLRAYEDKGLVAPSKAVMGIYCVCCLLQRGRME